MNFASFSNILKKHCFQEHFCLFTVGVNFLFLFRSRYLRCSLTKRCSLKFCRIHRKTPVSDLFFNKAAA